MRITSQAFDDGSTIPKRFGRDFENINPPLVIEDMPPETVSWTIIIDDPDVPSTAGVSIWDRWIVFNIPPSVKNVPEAWRPTGVRGKGTRGELEYGGPRPPDREHRYFFRIYALDRKLNLKEGAAKQEVIDAMRGHILAYAELMGRYAPQI